MENHLEVQGAASSTSSHLIVPGNNGRSSLLASDWDPELFSSFPSSEIDNCFGGSLPAFGWVDTPAQVCSLLYGFLELSFFYFPAPSGVLKIWLHWHWLGHIYDCFHVISLFNFHRTTRMSFCSQSFAFLQYLSRHLMETFSEFRLAKFRGSFEKHY